MQKKQGGNVNLTRDDKNDIFDLIKEEGNIK
jgi:hypothetical protein